MKRIAIAWFSVRVLLVMTAMSITAAGVIPPASAAISHKDARLGALAALNTELAQTYRSALRDLRILPRRDLPNVPVSTANRCGASCKRVLKQVRSDYDVWLLKVCPTTYLCQHPTPLIQGASMVDVCQDTSDCPKSMAAAVDRHYRWLFKHGGVKQFENEWKCGKRLQPCHVDCAKGVRCSGITDWIGLVNLLGYIANGACILLTDGVGLLVCTGVTAVITTVIDAVLTKANSKDKGAAAFTNGLVSAGPFLLSFLKMIFKHWATQGGGEP
jgi:hypothetical protein